MATLDIGKLWEEQFKKTWKAQFPGTLCFRLKDQMNGYKETSQNPCDFFCFPESSKFFMVECKAHAGSSISFSAMPQYGRLAGDKNNVGYIGIENVYPGFLVWLYEKDIVFWCPIETAKELHDKGEKSIGIRHFEDYNIIVLPIEKKRVNVFPDYSKMLEVNNDR